jgi:hypothetical protein
VCPRRGHDGPEEEYRYSSTPSLTSALDGGGRLTPRPGRFTPKKVTRYPFYRRRGDPQGRSGRVRKTSRPPGFYTRTIHYITCRYTDYTISAHNYKCLIYILSYLFYSLMSFTFYACFPKIKSQSFNKTKTSDSLILPFSILQLHYVAIRLPLRVHSLPIFLQ